MKQYNRILFVAESGTSRAPMAAGILSEYTLKHPVTIECRGLVVLFPEPLNQKAEAVMISNGINWENFTSTQLEDEDFTDDTLVLTMEHSQLEKIFEKYPSAREENVYVLTELVGDELEILDPYGGSLQSYGLCYETMRKSIIKLVKLLNGRRIKNMSKVVVMDHPLIQHKIGIMRRTDTGSKDFRTLVSEVAMLECYEATRDLKLTDVEIDTPICHATVKELRVKNLQSYLFYVQVLEW